MKKELKDKYVYLHRDVNNTIFYVGVGGKSRPKVTKTRSSEWKAIAKDGYSIEIHKKEITLSEAFKIEIDLIELIGRDNLGLGTLVNKTNGGAGALGVIVSKDTRSKLSESSAGEKNGMFGRTGDKNPFFGKKHTKETIEKIREVARISSKGSRNPMFRKTLSKESQNKRLTSIRRRSISDKNWELLLKDFSKIDKIVIGKTYKELSEKYSTSNNFIKRSFLRYKKNK